MHEQLEYKLLEKDKNLQPLQLDTKEKDLGIWFQNNLKFDEHCNYVVNRSNKLLGLIKRTFKALDKESFLILYKSLIRSILDYGGSVYYPSTKKNIQLIENIQRRSTKILPELRGLTYCERLERLKLPTLLKRRKRYDLIQLYVKPEYFFEFNDNCMRGHLFKIQKQSCKKDSEIKFIPYEMCSIKDYF